MLDIIVQQFTDQVVEVLKDPLNKYSEIFEAQPYALLEHRVYMRACELAKKRMEQFFQRHYGERYRSWCNLKVTSSHNPRRIIMILRGHGRMFALGYANDIFNAILAYDACGVSYITLPWCMLSRIDQLAEGPTVVDLIKNTFRLPLHIANSLRHAGDDALCWITTRPFDAQALQRVDPMQWKLPIKPARDPLDALKDYPIHLPQHFDINEYTRAFRAGLPEDGERETAVMAKVRYGHMWCTSGTGMRVIVIGRQFPEQEFEIDRYVPSLAGQIAGMANGTIQEEIIWLHSSSLRWRNNMHYVFEQARAKAAVKHSRASHAILVCCRNGYKIVLCQEMIYDQATDFLLDRVQDRNVLDIVRKFTAERADPRHIR